VYGIVKQSRGHIWVYSEPGHGTTFKVYFPRVADAELAPETAAPARAQQLVAASETLLLVEDDEAVRSAVRRILQRQGYHVLEAGDADEALAINVRHTGPIHLIISDLMLPEISGRVLMERFISLRPGTPVLFMSGYTDDDAIRRGLLFAHEAFIQKPFSMDELTRCVRTVLEGART
jgi:DNA-binding NtrC family response regulator